MVREALARSRGGLAEQSRPGSADSSLGTSSPRIDVAQFADTEAMSPMNDGGGPASFGNGPTGAGMASYFTVWQRLLRAAAGMQDQGSDDGGMQVPSSAPGQDSWLQASEGSDLQLILAAASGILEGMPQVE